MHFFSLDVMVSFSGMWFFYISSSVSNFFSGYVHSPKYEKKKYSALSII